MANGGRCGRCGNGEHERERSVRAAQVHARSRRRRESVQRCGLWSRQITAMPIADNTSSNASTDASSSESGNEGVNLLGLVTVDGDQVQVDGDDVQVS